MSNSIEVPEACRDLETPINQCVMMGKIAAQLSSGADDGSRPELCFAVFHLSEMLEKLERDYLAACYGGAIPCT